MFFNSQRDIEAQAKELLWGENPEEKKTVRKKFEGIFQDLFFRADMSQSEADKYLFQTLIAAVCIFLTVLVIKSFLTILIALLFCIFRYLGLVKRVYKRIVDFEHDYVPFIVSLASGVRTGLDPYVAFVECGKLFSPASTLNREVMKFQDEISKGTPEDSAVRNFASSILHPDIQLFRSTFILARREGSSLGFSLQRLAKVTRQRQSFRRKMRAAIAMQRLSAIGITGCAVIICTIQAATNFDSLKEAYNHPLGFTAMCFGASFICLGLFWMLYISRRRI